MKAIPLALCHGLLALLLALPSSAQGPGAEESGRAVDQETVRGQVTAEMVRLARELLDSVSGPPGGIETAVGYDRGALLALDFEDEARTDYVYWPYLRQGLPLEFMTAQQKSLVHDLLNSALSAKGYLTAVQIMQLERLLAAEEVIGFPRGEENYTLVIFGEPAADSLWGWRFEGHHLSLNFSVAPDDLRVTPSFFGASPAQQRSGPMAGFRVLRPIHELGRHFLQSLSESQRARAIEDGDPPADILGGNLNLPRERWDDWKDLPESGLPLAALDEGQKALARTLLEEVVGHYRPEIARSYLREIEVDDLRFTWLGGTGENDPHYWRLDGPDFFFEYDLVQGNGNHVHTVWRSKQGDFGADLLMRHRDAHAH